MCQKLAQKTSALIKGRTVQLVGPTDASIGRINDVYRRVLYLKAKEYGTLVEIKDCLEKYIKEEVQSKSVTIQFDFNPMSGF